MTAKPPAPLLAMRDALTACDLQIVQLLGERMRLIRRVAELKAQARLPSFDREREGALLDDLLAKAAEVDVPGDIVRDVYAALLSASRAAQRSVLHAGETHFSIGIIGGTAGMGAFLARLLDGAGYPVETTGLDRGAPSAEVASRHDLVVVAVPIGETVRVIEEVAPQVRRGACIADVTSVKIEPMRAMLAHAREDVDVVGTHPIFGPHGSDMDRQRVVLVRGRGESGFSRVKHLYETFGAEVIEATAEEHDAQMALIQVLLHEKTMVLGSVLERLKADLARTRHFASPIYRAELSMIGRMFFQRAELYAEILTSNEAGRATSRIFEEEATRLARAVGAGDRDALVSRFREIAAYMKEFAAWAKKESDAILADVVKHG
ncbi:MAG: prephenate dehydrogenase/arogenate dehydrogenase family protein [Polyangiaceae bacterium]|jgi:chorismate mutase / prephenate dehydrogenase